MTCHQRFAHRCDRRNDHAGDRLPRQNGISFVWSCGGMREARSSQTRRNVAAFRDAYVRVEQCRHQGHPEPRMGSSSNGACRARILAKALATSRLLIFLMGLKGRYKRLETRNEILRCGHVERHFVQELQVRGRWKGSLTHLDQVLAAAKASRPKKRLTLVA